MIVSSYSFEHLSNEYIYTIKINKVDITVRIIFLNDIFYDWVIVADNNADIYNDSDYFKNAKYEERKYILVRDEKILEIIEDIEKEIKNKKESNEK